MSNIPNGDYTHNNMLLLLCIYIKYMYNMYINSGGGAVKYGVCVYNRMACQQMILENESKNNIIVKKRIKK